MKIIFRHSAAAWNGETPLAVGFGLVIGKRLGARLLDVPTISGVHLVVGYFFGRFDLWIGTATKWRTEPELKFLKLEKL